MVSRGYARSGVLAAVLMPVVLGGCALPLPVQIASWAIDGISYVATQKSVADHGISLAMDQDCAILRTVTEGAPCRQGTNFEVQVAILGVKDQEAEGASTQVTFKEDIEADIEVDLEFEAATDAPAAVESVELAEADIEVDLDFETAAGPAADESASTEESMEVVETPVSVEPSPTTEQPVETASATPAETVTAVTNTVVAALKEGANLFYVIGSFASPERAHRLAERHNDLEPSVMPVKVRTKEVFRVLVGPYRQDEMRAAGKRLHKHGVKHAWGVRVDPEDWRQARLEPGQERPASSGDPSVAALPQ